MTIKKIVISAWSEFESKLRHELQLLGSYQRVVVRNFSGVTYDEQGNETDRLKIVLTTGTDRDSKSSYWNATGFDYQHAEEKPKKLPQELIYAFTVDLTQTPYLVHHGDIPEEIDVTKNLESFEGIIVYDAAKLDRVAKNEYWFRGPPLEAVLLVFTIEEQTEDDC